MARSHQRPGHFLMVRAPFVDPLALPPDFVLAMDERAALGA